MGFKLRGGDRPCWDVVRNVRVTAMPLEAKDLSEVGGVFPNSWVMGLLHRCANVVDACGGRCRIVVMGMAR